MSKAKDKDKPKLVLAKLPTTTDEIDALYRALTGKQEPMTEQERREMEAMLAEEAAD